MGTSAAWKQNQGNWYYLDNSGAMKTGWINDNGVWYFANASGVMQTGIVQVDGKNYSFTSVVTTTGAGVTITTDESEDVKVTD
ncbi:hypothetical protein [Clostridium saccharobutylicum]|uniref:hypothetical protein n=1 Tax=Clostridium saccharobutylicum TaxID=169679 RepID=UPI00214F8C36|nr:hypothetical protein [Clostridium saccharobutylicum]